LFSCTCSCFQHEVPAVWQDLGIQGAGKGETPCTETPFHLLIFSSSQKQLEKSKIFSLKDDKLLRRTSHKCTARTPGLLLTSTNTTGKPSALQRRGQEATAQSTAAPKGVKISQQVGEIISGMAKRGLKMQFPASPLPVCCSIS